MSRTTESYALVAEYTKLACPDSRVVNQAQGTCFEEGILAEDQPWQLRTGDMTAALGFSLIESLTKLIQERTGLRHSRKMPQCRQSYTDENTRKALQTSSGLANKCQQADISEESPIELKTWPVMSGSDR